MGSGATNIAYELQEFLPPNVQGSRIPRFRVTFKELIKFENWQGIGWVNFVLTANWISIIFGSLFCLVFLFVTLILNRIVMEVVISVLTIPHLIPLLQKQQDGHV